ncbi:MAG: membrane protein insertase YidC [Acidovorax sp.]
MNDIRRTILWVIFGFSLVMLWDKWQIHNGNKPLFFPSPTAVATAAPSAPADKGSAPAVPGQNAVANAPADGPVPVAGQKIDVETDVYKATIDGQGGTLAHLALTQYTDELNATGLIPWGRKLLGMAALPVVEQDVVLMDDASPATRYLAQTGLLNPAGGEKFPTHLTLMAAKPGPYKLEAGQDKLEVPFESQPVGGLKYVKTYVFQRGSYVIGVKHQIVNVGSAPATPQLYLQLQRHGTEPKGSMLGTSTFTGPAVYTDEKKFHKVNFADILKGKAELPDASQSGWIAMVQHYFASAWLLPVDNTVKREFRSASLGDNQFAVSMVLDLPAIAPGATQTVDTQLFAGPEEEKKLEALAPGLELVKDYGIFAIISKPLYWLLNQLHSVLGNWGWSIMAVVLLLKIAFYWLNAKAYASMAKMKAINPRITAMRERLKDKPQEMQQEMMRIYREEKVNPMGGCLPIVIQIPVFIGLYWVLLSSIEIRHAPWIGWIHDLSAPDPWFILPLLMTLSSLLQTALNPAPPDPMQAKMMWIMPLMFSVMFFFFPAGLVLYWLTNNILSIAQQWIINKRMGVPPQFNLPKFR